MYMPDLGRWGAMDPLAEAEQSSTPYRYGFDNPIRYTDPSDMIEISDVDRMLNTGGFL
jgi:RHS repeat-associated protein